MFNALVSVQSSKQLLAALQLESLKCAEILRFNIPAPSRDTTRRYIRSQRLSITCDIGEMVSHGVSVLSDCMHSAGVPPGCLPLALCVDETPIEAAFKLYKSRESDGTRLLIVGSCGVAGPTHRCSSSSLEVPEAVITAEDGWTALKTWLSKFKLAPCEFAHCQSCVLTLCVYQACILQMCLSTCYNL
jgi:hypothetical protein